MGHGACKSSINAIAIYLVKPKYFDDHKKKATSKIGKWKQGRKSQGKSSQKKAKTSQLAVNQNNAMTDSEGNNDDNDNGAASLWIPNDVLIEYTINSVN